RRDNACRDREPEELRLTVAVAPGGTALHADGARVGIYAHPAHLREVDHDPVVVDGVAGDVVPSALDREIEALLAREVDRVDDVGGTGPAHDECGAPIDQRVPERAPLVVAGTAGGENPPPPRPPEPRHSLRVETRLNRHCLPPLGTDTNLGRAYAGRPAQPR